MQRTWAFIVRHRLIWLGLLIHILFYLSAWQFKWFNFFFSGSSLHLCCRGLDFYQIPNGAYAYLHGGHLDGWLPPGLQPYGIGFPSNYNVYHPIFTLELGSFLMLFPPAASFYAWMAIKFCLTIPLLIYFYLNFRERKYICLAIFLTLINSTQYLEIEISQFHFVLNFFLFLLLIRAAKGKQSFWDGIFYVCTLLVKPIGLLWAPVLLFKKQYKTLFLGLILFVADTAFSLLTGTGQYYYDNLLFHVLHSSSSGPIQIITLDSLLRWIATPALLVSALKLGVLALIMLLTLSKRVSLVTGVYLTVVYYLLFYDLVYEYHYTTMIPLLAVGLVCCPEFQTRWARFFIVLASLPNIFFFLRLIHVGVSPDSLLGSDPTVLGWELIVLSRILPLIGLSIVVLWPIVRLIVQDMKVFVLIFGKVSKEMALLEQPVTAVALEEGATNEALEQPIIMLAMEEGAVNEVLEQPVTAVALVEVTYEALEQPVTAVALVEEATNAEGVNVSPPELQLSGPTPHGSDLPL